MGDYNVYTYTELRQSLLHNCPVASAHCAQISSNLTGLGQNWGNFENTALISPASPLGGLVPGPMFPLGGVDRLTPGPISLLVGEFVSKPVSPLRW